MLQRNTQNAHLAHAAVVSLHAVCCGAPLLALVATSLWGTASVLAAFGAWVAPAHEALHGFELWILAVSALLVIVGGLLEWHARKRSGRRHFPWLFGISVGCFVANAALIGAHYLAHF
jgi:drug/metabolite transporter (DMT)-like permease